MTTIKELITELQCKNPDSSKLKNIDSYIPNDELKDCNDYYWLTLILNELGINFSKDEAKYYKAHDQAHLKLHKAERQAHTQYHQDMALVLADPSFAKSNEIVPQKEAQYKEEKVQLKFKCDEEAKQAHSQYIQVLKSLTLDTVAKLD